MLESSRFDSENERSYFFLRPERIISIYRLEDIPKLFSEIEENLNQGLFVAGYFSYECGFHFETIVRHVPHHPFLPLAWFGVYRAPLVYHHKSGTFEGGMPDIPPATEVPYSLKNCSLNISEGEYTKAIEVIKEYIAAGDTYQVNFTDKYTFDFDGSPISCFTGLRNKQKVGYSAFINAGGKYILSFSPELFFKLSGDRLITKPMKGTARRGKYLSEDDSIQKWLQNDEKNRSENLMIVDLLRNDVGRIAEAGSVVVKEMFAVEKYETLFQMTSTIQGTLKNNVSWYELLKSMFPSGSVTGAPKIRTMQIIHQLEHKPRGVYTGAIGYFSPNKEAMFNVAIRTLVIDGTKGEMGIGSGIVFDSDARQEYEECRLKAEFLTRPPENFQLIESLLWNGTYRLLSFHIDRLRASAEHFGFSIDSENIFQRLISNQQKLSQTKAYKVRVLLESTGAVSIENQPLSNIPSSGKIIISPLRTFSGDKFLFHKTTRRRVYDSELDKAVLLGCDDVLFYNEKNEVTEGAISNIFIEQNGGLYTPPLACGLLPGVYRRHVLENRHGASEKALFHEDLIGADAIFICNSVRGMRKVELIT
ncbi:MAG: aminodeoxychorismate synthase component I [Bacteroidota bacterium]